MIEDKLSYRFFLMLFGYVRTSTPDQSPNLQFDALVTAGCHRANIYSDVASGAKTERPALTKLLTLLQSGDTLVVWKLDRLGRSLAHLIEIVEMLNGRSLAHLIEIVEMLNGRGIGFQSLQERFDTTHPGGKLIFNIFGAIAEFERSLIRERTEAGLRAARARGRVGGRPRKMDEKKIARVRELYAANTMRPEELARSMGVSVPTLYRALNLSNSGIKVDAPNPSMTV